MCGCNAKCTQVLHLNEYNHPISVEEEKWRNHAVCNALFDWSRHSYGLA